MEKPQFIEIDSQKIIDEIKADYELATGKKLQPGQAEMLIFDAFAYRETLIRSGIQYAAEQNLVDFAVAPALDFLGVLVGVNRLPASKAGCLLRLHLVAGHNALVIPSGLRVQSMDGLVVFSTIEQKAVAEDVLSVDIKAECNIEGVAGNNYALNAISVILDPQPYLTGAENLTVTSGGADEENDEELRERIRLAPSQYSTAGPDDAYKFFAKSAHPSIIDVAIGSEVAGEVDIYPLLIGGESPSSEIMDLVRAACNPEKRRPLNDTVNVYAPLVESYEIEVNLTLVTDAPATDIVNTVTQNLQTYANKRKVTMGLDVVISQIIAQANTAQVYKVAVVSPATDLVMPKNKHAVCSAITVNVLGFSDE